MLRAQQARIAWSGGTPFEMTFDTAQARRVALVGEWSALFNFATGSAELVSGSVSVAGEPLHVGLRSNTAAIAPAQLALPKDWTVSEYLSTTGSLLRLPRSAPDTLLGAFGLLGMAQRKLPTLQEAERRALSLLQACLGSPRLILVETPFAGLDHTGQRFLCTLLEKVPADTLLLVSYGVAGTTLGPGTPAEGFLRQVERVLLAAGNQGGTDVAVTDLLDSATQFRLTVSKRADSVRQHLTDAGVTVQPTGVSALLVDLPTAATFIVTVPAGAGTSSLLDATCSAGASVIELVPLRPSL